MRERLTRVASWALVALGLGLLGWRLVGIEHAPFILDEPQLLDGARAQLESGQWMTQSTLTGTSDYRYGAAAFWFYSAVQRLFGPSPYAAIYAMAVLVTTAQAFFCACVARAVSSADGLARNWLQTPHERWILGTLLLVAASSPHQHFWSRLAWDQLTNVVAFTTVGLLILPGIRDWPGLVLIGSLLGFGLSSHPMLLPHAVIVGLAVVTQRSETWRTVVARSTAVVAPALLVLLPWLRQFWSHGPGTSAGASMGLTAARFLESFRAPGVAGVDYFFDEDWTAFLSSSYAPSPTEHLITVSALVWIILGLVGLLAAWRSPIGRMRRIALCGLASLLIYPVFYAAVGVPMEPHYQFPTGWVPLAAAGFLIGAPTAWLRRATTVLLLILAVWQLTFIAGWRDWIHTRDGTRGPHYAVALIEQERTVATVCRHSSQPSFVTLDVIAYSHSFDYLSSVALGCRGLSVHWCGTFNEDCRDPLPGEAVARVTYAEDVGAALKVTWQRSALTTRADD